MDRERRWFWVTLGLSTVSIVALVYAAWELIGNQFFRDVDYITLHSMYVTRGIVSSVLLAFWAAWYVSRQRRASEDELRRSREHYRSLLDASPGAVALYDRSRRVLEWNKTAERTYGFARAEVLGSPLPTVPAEKMAEWEQLLAWVERNESVLDVETLRRAKSGELLNVGVSLLPFDRDGERCCLEVSENIQERMRLREKLIEIEKLSSMGRMAAGTAHHLNTPLAAMLLRVQMMRDAAPSPHLASDLERLESGIHFCQHFVRRLLDFSRRRPVEKQPEDIGLIVQSVVSFLAPSIEAKHATVRVDVGGARNSKVLADRNLLEVLFSTLLSNALDAIPDRGWIAATCGMRDDGSIEIQIRDSGTGIKPADLPHVFEPFFTTKGTGKGTGLGLAIARNIVLEHGGTIHLESPPGEGATAVINLPVHSSAAVSEAVASP